MSGWDDGFGGDIKLDIINIAVEVETMVANDVAKGEQVEYEEERTKEERTTRCWNCISQLITGRCNRERLLSGSTHSSSLFLKWNHRRPRTAESEVREL